MSLSHPLGLAATWLAADSGIQNKIFGSGTPTSINSNKEMEDITKIVKSLEESGLLLKGANEAIKNEAKEQKDGFLGMLLDPLNASLLEIMFQGVKLPWKCPVIFFACTICPGNNLERFW